MKNARNTFDVWKSFFIVVRKAASRAEGKLIVSLSCGELMALEIVCVYIYFAAWNLLLISFAKPLKALSAREWEKRCRKYNVNRGKWYFCLDEAIEVEDDRVKTERSEWGFSWKIRWKTLTREWNDERWREEKYKNGSCVQLYAIYTHFFLIVYYYYCLFFPLNVLMCFSV